MIRAVLTGIAAGAAGTTAPHLAYGFATAAVWELMKPGRRRRRS